MSCLWARFLKNAAIIRLPSRLVGVALPYSFEFSASLRAASDDVLIW
jgi:hypothetical protein